MSVTKAALVATALAVFSSGASAATLTYEGMGGNAQVTVQNGVGGAAPNYINSTAAQTSGFGFNLYVFDAEFFLAI